MHDISDSIHQLFSKLLNISRSRDIVSFESSHYKVGSGFKIFNTNGSKELHPHDEIGLLGFSHPLSIKTSLTSAIIPEYFSNEESIVNLVKDLEVFFSTLAGHDLYINMPKDDAHSAMHAGRYHRFLSDEDYKKLKTHDLNIDYILPFSFSLSKSKTDLALKKLTTKQVLFSNAFLRLITLGQFYSGSNLVKKRSEKLCTKLTKLDFVSEVAGLTIKIDSKFDIEKLSHRGLVCKSHTITLPLFYDDEDIDHLISILQEEFKCL